MDERERLFMRLRDEIEYVHPLPSNANFMLCEVSGRDAKEIKDRLAWEDGIMIRYYDKPADLQNCFRISVGKPEHTDALINALKAK
jgi:histidinol-phosphate aminotransferase